MDQGGVYQILLERSEFTIRDMVVKFINILQVIA